MRPPALLSRPLVVSGWISAQVALLAVGCGALVAGAWDIARPAGLILLGLFLAAGSVAIAAVRGGRAPARKRPRSSR